MEKITPVALFAYNRPNHIRRALESLAACRRLRECRLLVFCDGPKRTDDVESVGLTREVVRNWAKAHGAEVIERETNLGLANSIVTGVSDLCREHGRVIVIEDDLVVSPDFIDYMLQGLDRYEDQPEVYQVSGCVPAEKPNTTYAYFLPLTTTWGWATWERAWKIFQWEPENAQDELAQSEMRHRFDLDGVCSYTTMLEERLAGRNDSWGILWWWAVFQANGLVLYPPRSLVYNNGFDDTGVHCGSNSVFRQASLDAFSQPRLTGELVFPVSLEPDYAAFDLVKAALGNTTAVSDTVPQGRWSARVRRLFGRRHPDM